MKIPAILFLSFLVWACNSQDDASSPFDEILSKPPFASITDSIRKQPDRDDLYFRRAVLLNKNNLPEPALVDFRKAWSIAPAESYAVGVSNILLEKKPDSAVIFLKKAIEEIPNSLFLQLSLARAYDAQGKTDEALAACNYLLQNEPGQVNALMLKSDLLLKKEDTSGAITALERAYSSVPFNREISNKLAYQYAEAKNNKAISLADSLIRKDSLKLFAEPYYVKGMYYSNIKDRAKAIQQFDATIKQDHRYLNAYIEKGKILFDQKKIAEALKTFELANRITPSFPDAWYWMGRCQEISGQKEEAKLNYEKAYSLDKTFTEAKEAAEKIEIVDKLTRNRLPVTCNPPTSRILQRKFQTLMPIIAPSLLASNFFKMEDECKMLNQSVADWYHLDVMDGRFVPNISFGPMIIEFFRKATTKAL